MAGFRGRLPGAGAQRAEGVSGVTVELLLAAVGVLGTLGGAALTSSLRRLSNQQEQIWGMQTDAAKQLTEAVGELRISQLNILSRLVRLETLMGDRLTTS